MNWWTMRLATVQGPPGARVDPALLTAARRMPFAWALEAYIAQDALDEVADIHREGAS